MTFPSMYVVTTKIESQLPMLVCNCNIFLWIINFSVNSFIFCNQMLCMPSMSVCCCSGGRSQTTLRRWVGGTRNVNGIQIFHYNNKEIPLQMSMQVVNNGHNLINVVKERPLVRYLLLLFPVADSDKWRDHMF